MLIRVMPLCFIASSLSWLKVWGIPSRVTSICGGMSNTPRTMSIRRGYWSALYRFDVPPPK